MKRWIVVSFLLTGILLKLQAESPIRVGLRGGFELVEMNFSSDDLNSSNRSGFFIGPVLKFQLPIVGLGIDAGLQYSYRNLKVEGSNFYQNSLLLPANVRYGVSIGNALGIFATIGPQFSFNIGDDVLHWVDEDGNNQQFTLQNTMLSFNLGVGVALGQHLEASLCYNIPMGKTGDFTWTTLQSEVKELTWNSAKTKNNAWRLSLSLYF